MTPTATVVTPVPLETIRGILKEVAKVKKVNKQYKMYVTKKQKPSKTLVQQHLLLPTAYGELKSIQKLKVIMYLGLLHK